MTSFNQLLSRTRIKSKNKKPNGFTMIELMIGVAIVGTLSAVALPELSKAQNRAKDTAAESLLINASKECSLELILDPTKAKATFAKTQDSGEKFDGVTGDCEIANGVGPTLKTTSATGEKYMSVFTDSTPGEVEEDPS
ncbi:type IV pilin protein [Synechococcus sp. MIT S9508]|uniref:type IV pilin protein n=1 Tax=Synechococcus sp. MIT S9508 TaxID=1801629 RepID=UPI0007BBB45F|nr:type II secretion system protein [Synechococcus sp. MIT S9508]KZR89950.1 hypothetical protein MITS9508_01024 [Synechococcus sp. MIT S9508]